MAQLEGGLRDRMLIESFYQMLRSNLTTLGWFNPGRQHEPINMTPIPMPRGQEIPPNTLTVTWEDIDSTEAEMGSNAAELTHTAYVDFYAEPAPPDGNGGEALGKQMIGDVRAIILGEMPSIGRDANVLQVLNYSLATPTYMFTVEFDIERTRSSKVHHYDQPWERWWYSCIVEVIEERFGTD